MVKLLLDEFVDAGQAMDQPLVVELGTCRSTSAPTVHYSWFPNARQYVGVDIQQGLDVDVVADVHRLSATLGVESADIIISCSTFEHIKYPFLAAHELMKTLKVGGILFIQTHQTYPLHSYPSDFYRYSADGLAALFGTQNGFDVIATDHEFPAQIRSEEIGTHTNAYLNSRLYGRKVTPTPDDYIYDLSEDGR